VKSARAANSPWMAKPVPCAIESIIRSRIPRRHAHRTRVPYVPIVPMSVKTPVVASMLYIETSFDPEFVT